MQRMILPAFLLALSFSLVVRADVNVPQDYDTIQEAIDAIALDPLLGDTVIIARGNYEESVRLISDITLQGEETALTVLKPGLDLLQPTITASNVANVTVRNLSFESASTAIFVTNSNNVTVSSNVFRLEKPATAVEVNGLSPVRVINNTFFDNGVAINRASNQVEVVNNIFASNTTTIEPSDIDGNISFNCYNSNTINLPLGSNAVVEDDALFVNTALGDFHLREGSPCIDQGTGTDIIDGSQADMGAYGGNDADALPFPVQSIVASDASASVGTPSVKVDWAANLSYLVTNSSSPGGYELYYDSDAPGPPYNGTDAGGGTQPSPINVGNVTTFTLADLSPVSNAPPAPVITRVAPSNQTLDISWSVVAGATSYALYYGTGNVTENRLDVGNVNSFRLTGLQNNLTYLLAVSATAQTTYYVNVRAFDNTGEPSHISDFGTESSIDLGNALESALSPTVAGIPEEVVAFPELSGDSSCFIATAANGDSGAPQVRVLRRLRDGYLLESAAGRWLVSQYYAYSPPVARYLDEHPALKPLVRALLTPLEAFTLFLEHTGWMARSLLCLSLAVLVLLVYRRRLRGAGQHG